MWLFAIFVAVPIVEIALFIQVGGLIGLWPTLAIVVATAALGTGLVRRQGLAALRQVQASFTDLRDPTRPLAHGAMILAAGLLLLTPGFFTDALGLALLVPGVRDAVLGYIRRRLAVRSFTMGRSGMAPPPPAREDVVEGEFVEMPRREGPSGWRRGP